MKLPYQQLDQSLSKKLAPLYLVNSDELLLVQEAREAIRQAAEKAGFSERVSLTVEPNSDWAKVLFAKANSFSLFSTKQIIELHIAGTKPNAEASKILQEIAASPLPDTILIITSNKLDSKTEQTSWYKALDKIGVVIQIWPIALPQLPAWVMQRAKKHGLTMTPDAAKFLAEQVEGNLLAAAQEIEKLSLLQLSGTIDLNMMTKAVTDNARFDIFSLVECALAGQAKRSLRILNNLHTEDTEPVLILWALARELRVLGEIGLQLKQGMAIASLFSKFRIWEKRQAGVRQFLQRHPPQSIFSLIADSAKIDRIIKGANQGNLWDELQSLVLKMTGNGIITLSIE